MRIFTCKLTTLAAAISVVFLLLLHAAAASAQTTAARPDRGMMPNGSYTVSDIENISVTNGNVNLSIPLASLPPIAGGKLGLTLNAVYNSKLWNSTRAEQQRSLMQGCQSWVVDTPQLSDLGGWRISGSYSIVFRNAHEDFDYIMPQPPGTPDCESNTQEQVLLQYQWYRAILIAPDGSEHELRPTDGYTTYGGSREYLRNYYNQKPDALGAPMRYYSLDGSYLSAIINPSSYGTSWTVYMKDGTTVIQYSSGVQKIRDTNGNTVKIYSDTGGTHYQDEQTGREIRYDALNGKVWYQAVTGTSYSIDLVWGTTTVQGKLYRVNAWSDSGGETGEGTACWHDELLQTQMSVLREIVFPVTESGVSARRFSFSYNSDTTSSATDNAQWACGMAPQSYTRTVSKGMGELSQMTTPAGATVNYSYSRDNTHYVWTPDEYAKGTITQKEIKDGGTSLGTWVYSIDEFNGIGGTVTAPDGSSTAETSYTGSPGMGQFFGSGGKAGLVYRSKTSNTQMVERHWIMTPFSGANTYATGSFQSATFNPVVDAEYLSLLDSSGVAVRMSAKTYQYDFNGNLIQQTDYDWFDPALVSRDTSGVPTGVPASATVLRTTSNTYYNPATSSSSANVYAKRALATGTPLILSALQQTTTGPATTQLSYDGQAYGTAPSIGNLTSQSVWDDLDNKWITSSQTYGAYGNLASKTDARGKVTQFYYDDSTHALPNRVVVDPQNGTSTQTTAIAYDYYTGLIINQTDANNAISTINYTNQSTGVIDPFGRPGISFGPLVNGSQHQRVTTTYKDSSRQVIVATDLNTENDQQLKTRTTVDVLGRVVLTEQSENGSTYSISSQKVYEQMGKISYTSNPMRIGAASSDGWTRVTNDNAGRVVEVATFGGSAKPSDSGCTTNCTGTVSTAYDSEFTTATDQASKVRRSKVDALGRLIRVDEPTTSGLGTTSSPNQATSYSYSVLGNLLTVTQGSQTRTFTYDSLSRLRTAVNPESGTVTYVYDDNGNLTRKTDARGIYIDYVYDALNRATSRTYSDGTPAVTYTYDAAGISNSKGRLTSVSSTVSTTNTTAFDAGGKTLSGNQVTDGQTYSMSYGYNLAGGLTSLTYPSGRVIRTEYDAAGRMAGVWDQGSGAYYAGAVSTDATNRLQYAPHGAVSVMKLGNGLWEHTDFNSRMQRTLIGLGTSSTNSGTLGLTYNYGTSNNNGNVQSIAYSGGGLSYTQSFGYDELNRLTTSSESSSWSQTNSYDRYGNRAVVGAALSFSASNNRITTAGYAYDAAGNLTSDVAHSYAFDAENKIKTVDGVSDIYRYDGDGNRVRKNFTGGDKIRMVYSGGQLLAEYDLTNGSLKKEYVYRAKGLIATIEPTNGTRYATADHLGTPRIITNSSAGVVSRHDYMPFGEEIGTGFAGRTSAMGFSVVDGQRQKFTSKERDVETGLDYFNARFYASTQGRFTTPDPLLSSGRPLQPQSWNRYTYVINRPLSMVDPNGLDWGVTEWDDKRGHHTNYHWFDSKVGKHNGRNYTAVNFGKSGSLDIVADGGTVIRISNLGLKRQVISRGPSGDGVSGLQETLNLAAGHLHGIVSAANSANPAAQPVVDWLFDQIGGVDSNSEMFGRGHAVGSGITAGALLFTPLVEVEYVNLTKQIASESQVVEIVAGEGRAIMGAGTNRVLTDAPRLAAEYGGQASDWAKVTSWAFKAADRSVLETHAYKNAATGRIVEMKSVSSKFPGR
jgi:RHS repeat-associated protein